MKSLWERIEGSEAKHAEECLSLFSETVKAAGSAKYVFSEGVKEKGKCYVISESGRKGSLFVHVVPKDLIRLFREAQKKAPDEFLGFSVLAGKHNGMDVRVSCFGIPCGLAGKALFGKSGVKKAKDVL